MNNLLEKQEYERKKTALATVTLLKKRLSDSIPFGSDVQDLVVTTMKFFETLLFTSSSDVNLEKLTNELIGYVRRVRPTNSSASEGYNVDLPVRDQAGRDLVITFKTFDYPGNSADCVQIILKPGFFVNDYCYTGELVSFHLDRKLNTFAESDDYMIGRNLMSTEASSESLQKVSK